MAAQLADVGNPAHPLTSGQSAPGRSGQPRPRSGRALRRPHAMVAQQHRRPVAGESPAPPPVSRSTCRTPQGVPSGSTTGRRAVHGLPPPRPLDEPDDEHRAHPSIAHIPTRTSCATGSSSCPVFAGSAQNPADVIGEPRCIQRACPRPRLRR
jgi:hypothetical protein